MWGFVTFAMIMLLSDTVFSGTLWFVLATGATVVALAVAGAFFLCRRRNATLSIMRLDEAARRYADRGVILYDVNGRLIRANSRAHELMWRMGLDEHDIDNQMKMRHFLREAEVANPDPAMQQISCERFLTEQEYLFSGLIQGNGTLVVAQFGSGGKDGYFVVIQDVSVQYDSLAREQDMEYRNHMLSAVLQASSFGVMVSDAQAEGNPILYVNQKLIEILGREVDVKVEDLVGLPLKKALSLYCPDCMPQDKIQRLLEIGETQSGEIEKQNGETLAWYNLELVAIPDAAGNPDLFVGTLEDKTQEKMRETHFYQNQKLESLGQLAGGVAHDFNNIMSIIDGYARIAAKEVGDNESAQSYLERIQKAVKRGASLTRQLLTFGRHNVVIESITDIGKLVREQETLLETLLDASIDMEVQAEDGLFVECASDAIGQILLNLVVNARDAMPEGGKIMIEAMRHEGDAPGRMPPGMRLDSELCYMRVSDTGCGIDEEIRSKIFDPFFTTKDQGKGTGLGLSMVYGLVQQMGGFIDVTSAKGKGTTISIYLPVSAKKPVKKVTQADGDGGALRLDGYTALIAEDEPDLLQLIAGMLEDMGMQVITAANGNDALVKQDDFEGEIDFLLTDVVMPELNGVKLAELFESLRPDSKVVFMSGYPANGQLARIQLPDGAYLLPKPIEYEKLAYILKTLAAGEQDTAEETRRRAGQWTTSTTKF